MSTPPRMVELLCCSCGNSHWEIDHDYRGMFGQKVRYSQRTYNCPHCQCEGSGYLVLQKSPRMFFLQPHSVYPMSRTDFEYWTEVFRQNFPGHPYLSDLKKSWYANGGNGWLRSRISRLLRELLRQARMRTHAVTRAF